MITEAAGGPSRPGHVPVRTAVTGTAETQAESGVPRSWEMTAEECREHLASASMGRVAWDVGGLQQILPVNYVVHAGQVVFRTSPYGSLAFLHRPTSVAFEVDRVDELAGTGWSVVVQGRAEAVTLPQELGDLWARPDLVPWAPGTRNLIISITPHAISGRIVRAPFSA